MIPIFCPYFFSNLFNYLVQFMPYFLMSFDLLCLLIVLLDDKLATGLTVPLRINSFGNFEDINV